MLCLCLCSLGRLPLSPWAWRPASFSYFSAFLSGFTLGLSPSPPSLTQPLPHSIVHPLPTSVSPVAPTRHPECMHLCVDLPRLVGTCPVPACAPPGLSVFLPASVSLQDSHSLSLLGCESVSVCLNLVSCLPVRPFLFYRSAVWL